ncbi:MAG TPA: hypothetical protein VHV77_17330, partial [Pirellulales bacterium]|nr:hypothetical protein [Pirellulales bacterium]
MSTAPLDGNVRLLRWRRGAAGVGLLAGAGCVAAAILLPVPFMRAYLASYTFFLGLALGSLALLLLYHLTGGAWGYLIRSILEAQTRTLPLFALLFLPIGFLAPELYKWAATNVALSEPGYEPQQWYLTMPLFWVRAGVYFIIWLGLMWLLNNVTRRQADDASPRWPWRARNISGI